MRVNLEGATAYCSQAGNAFNITNTSTYGTRIILREVVGGLRENS